MQVWTDRIVLAVIVALQPLSIWGVVWGIDILHDHGIAREWMVLLPIATLVGPFGIFYIIDKISMKKKIRVSATEEQWVIGGDAWHSPDDERREP